MITFLITFHFENCETLILHGSKSSRNSSSPAAGRKTKAQKTDKIVCSELLFAFFPFYGKKCGYCISSG